MLLSCTDVTCDGTAPEARMARGLSKARLERLYEEGRAYATESGIVSPAPPEFSDLGAVGLRSYRPGLLNVRLRGCLDHFLDIVVEYPGERNSALAKGTISLRYGEFPVETEVLWEAPK